VVKAKSKQQQNGQNQKKISPFPFCFCPAEGNSDVLPRTGGAKAKCQNLEWQKKIGQK
jgi:hypothetical protein